MDLQIEDIRLNTKRLNLIENQIITMLSMPFSLFIFSPSMPLQNQMSDNRNNSPANVMPNYEEEKDYCLPKLETPLIDEDSHARVSVCA